MSKGILKGGEAPAILEETNGRYDCSNRDSDKSRRDQRDPTQRTAGIGDGGGCLCDTVRQKERFTQGGEPHHSLWIYRGERRAHR